MRISCYNPKNIKSLLSNSNVNHQDIFGWTLLMWASVYNFDSVKMLLKYNDIQVNVKDNNEWTALIWSSQYNTESVKLLLHHPDINITIYKNIITNTLKYNYNLLDIDVYSNIVRDREHCERLRTIKMN